MPEARPTILMANDSLTVLHLASENLNLFELNVQMEDAQAIEVV